MTFCELRSGCFDECAIALKELASDSALNGPDDRDLELIRQTIDVTGILVWDQRGKFFARAEQLSPVECAAFEDAVARVQSVLESAACRGMP